MHKLKPILLIACLLLSGLIFFSGQASAHIYASDGNIHVLLHINPDDYPVINQPQTLNFIYSEPGANFDANDYACTVTLKQGGNQIFQGVVPPASNYFGKITYTFTQIGVYQVLLSCNPNDSSAGQAFNVSYNIRVAKSEPGDETTAASTAGSGKNGTNAAGSGSGNSVVLIAIAVTVISLGACGYVAYNNIKSQGKGKARVDK